MPSTENNMWILQKVGHHESACITKYTQRNKETKENRSGHTRQSPTKRRPATPTPNKRPSVNTNMLVIKPSEQLKTDFQRIHSDFISTVTPKKRKTRTYIDTVTVLDTDRNGKTYDLKDIDVQITYGTDWDLLCIKLDMGAEANILPVRTYSRMFPDRLLPDRTPDLNYLQATHLKFKCNRNSVIQSLGCVNCDTELPGKELIKLTLSSFYPGTMTKS